MTPGNRMSQASSTVDFDHRVHACRHTRARARGHTNTSYNHFPLLPYPPSPVFHSHVIDAPAKTPSIFRAHGSAICSTHKRMTSLQVVCNVECKSALNPPLYNENATHIVLSVTIEVIDLTERKCEVLPNFFYSQSFIRCIWNRPLFPKKEGNMLREIIVLITKIVVSRTET